MFKTGLQTPPVSPVHVRLATIFVTFLCVLTTSKCPVLTSYRDDEDVKRWTRNVTMYYVKNYNIFRRFREDAEATVGHINLERSGRAAA